MILFLGMVNLNEQNRKRNGEKNNKKNLVNDLKPNKLNHV